MKKAVKNLTFTIKETDFNFKVNFDTYLISNDNQQVKLLKRFTFDKPGYGLDKVKNIDYLKLNKAIKKRLSEILPEFNFKNTELKLNNN
jgi:hypothetical protein